MTEYCTEENIKIAHKWLSILTGIGLIINGVLRYILFDISILEPWTIFQPAYLILFGLMIMGAEFESQYLLERIRFMNSYLGRGIFDLFVATICSSFMNGSGMNVFAIVLTITLGFIGLVSLIWYFQNKKIGDSGSRSKSSSLDIQPGPQSKTSNQTDTSGSIEKPLYGSEYVSKH